MTTFEERLQQAYNTEKKQIQNEIKTDNGKSVSIMRFHQRLDQAINGAFAFSKSTPACKKGCAYCCEFKVEAGAEEIFLAIDHAQKTLSKEQQAGILDRAKHNKKTLSLMNQAARIQANVSCAFLSDSECLIYEARPAMCRKMHSLKVDPCRQSYEQPDNDVIENAELNLVTAITTTAISASRDGINESGQDAKIYDLNLVLADALENSKLRKRWNQGKKAFPAY
jgi:Fe-S-cluster containining protein